MSITIQQTYYEPIPTGKYLAKIIPIDESDRQFGLQLKFAFALRPNDHYESRTLFGWTTRIFSDQSILYELTRAALGGGPIDRCYIFNSDDLIGHRVYPIVMNEEGEKGYFNKIQKVMPYHLPSPQPSPKQEFPDDLPF